MQMKLENNSRCIREDLFRGEVLGATSFLGEWCREAFRVKSNTESLHLNVVQSVYYKIVYFIERNRIDFFSRAESVPYIFLFIQASQNLTGIRYHNRKKQHFQMQFMKYT